MGLTSKKSGSSFRGIVCLTSMEECLHPGPLWPMLYCTEAEGDDESCGGRRMSLEWVKEIS